jgi:hypothetical protein
MKESASFQVAPSERAQEPRFADNDRIRLWNRAWTGDDPLDEYGEMASVGSMYPAHSEFYDANYVLTRAYWLRKYVGIPASWRHGAVAPGFHGGGTAVASYKAAMVAFSTIRAESLGEPVSFEVLDAMIPSGLIDYKYALPAPSAVAGPTAQQRERFNQLAREWLDDTAASSSLTDKALHPAYQRIIGMGPVAITMVLEELERELGHWFWALGALAPDDENPAEDASDLEDARASWLKWGREKGYLPEAP